MSRDTRRAHKRRADFLGLPLLIEIEVGDVIKGTGDEGEKWEKTYDCAYGEIDTTLAPTDGDPVDVYLGPIADAAPEASRALESLTMVYVVHQLRKDGTPDEDKVMLGFPHAPAAADAYRRHGPPWGFGGMDTMTLDQFVHGYLAANRAPAATAPHTAAARQALGQSRYGS